MIDAPTSPAVLFACVHNAGRSQMAAAFARHLSRGKVRATSAGSDPGFEVNPVAVGVMAEIGLDISQQIPSALSDSAVSTADLVVTMGCGDSCPVRPGQRHEDWAIDDPAGRDRASVRRIRDEIEQRVRKLLVELGIDLTV